MPRETTFLSYARADSAFAVRLASDLRKNGADVWLDQLDIPVGARWDTSVEKALRSASRLIVVLSPRSVESANVLDEVSYALGKGKAVLPVRMEPCETPLRLHRFQYVDLGGDYESGINRLLAVLGHVRSASAPPVPADEPGKPIAVLRPTKPAGDDEPGWPVAKPERPGARASVVDEETDTRPRKAHGEGTARATSHEAEATRPEAPLFADPQNAFPTAKSFLASQPRLALAIAGALLLGVLFLLLQPSPGDEGRTAQSSTDSPTEYPVVEPAASTTRKPDPPRMAAVLDAVSKGPIRHARVTVDGDAAHTLTTDSAGLFALPRDPGTVNLLIEADGYDAERVAVELTGRSEYRFYLKKRVVSAGRTAAPPASQRPLEPATSADSSRAVRVGGAIQVPTKTKDVRPVYPPIAQAARVQGAVIVEAVIGVDGSVTDARVLRSIPLLDEAALDAVKQWEFTPTLLNGRPVAVIMTVTVNFSLTTDADDILAHINRLEALGDAKAAADLLRSAFDGPTMVPGGSVFDELRARLKTANTAQIAAALKLIQSQR